MKILFINKFLQPRGGTETYIFKLGTYLTSQGYQVQYFGMDDSERCVENRVQSYTSPMDFHHAGIAAKFRYSIKTIYSAEARRKIRLVLDDFAPDVCHLNNFNYQLTPAVILEIDRWRRETGKKCRIVYTAHDYQLLCPDHLLYNEKTGQTCEKCLNGRFGSCIRGRCIHGSALKSVVGSIEATVWNKLFPVYKKIDAIICCSAFMKEKLDGNPILKEKTVILRNFAPFTSGKAAEKEDYALYFGRFSTEKGVDLLLDACRRMSERRFIFAGSGPLEEELRDIPNVENRGFLTGKPLQDLIARAQFTVCPSLWYENCPFSVMESQLLGTAVIGARIGGIPELICSGQTGELFEAGNAEDLCQTMEKFWREPYVCQNPAIATVSEYTEELMKIYAGEKP